jgi:hypothetical protein
VANHGTSIGFILFCVVVCLSRTEEASAECGKLIVIRATEFFHGRRGNE